MRGNMNIQKHTQNAKHRWLVAAPLFLLMFTLSLRDVFIASVPAASLITDEQVVVDGAQVSRQDNASTLVYSPYLSRFEAGEYTLEGWNGGYQVTVGAVSITVAALTTPVLVTHGKEQTIVPAFTQWKGETLAPLSGSLDLWYLSREVLPLPADYTQTMLRSLSQLATFVPAESGTSSDETILPHTIGQSLRFEQAQERAAQMERLQRIEALRTALQSDVPSFDTLLLASDIDDILTSPEGRSALPELLTLATRVHKDHLLLPFFVADSKYRLLAAFHPLLRDSARVVPQSAELRGQTERLFLLFTPAADVLPAAITELAITQWQDQWKSLTATKEGIADFSAALPFIESQIEQFDTLQYPQRVETYSTAILAVADPLEQKLTPDARKVLQGIRTLRTERRLASPIPDPVAVVVSPAASSASSAKHVDVSPDILIEQTAFILANAGFMSTAQTILKPVGSVVEVSEIVFGTANGDTTLHFSFDPQTGLVSAIHHQGQILPYAISLQQFTEWLQTK